MDFEVEIKREFLLEAQELIELAEESFLQFERDTSDLEVIDNIFRLFHTLKGSSFTAGFDQLGGFTHKVENILSSIKNQEIETSNEVCNILIRSNDVLSDWITQLNQDFEYQNDGISSLEQELDNFQIIKEVETVSGSGFGFFDDQEDSPSETVVAETAAPQKVEEVANIPHPIFSHKKNAAKVLIVDDEESIRELISLMLEELDIDTITASDGLEGLKATEEQKPDVILTDLKMPNMDGLEFIQKVREFDSQVPVLFISGASGREDIIAFMSVGSLGFIEKPINGDMLVNQVRNAIYIKRMKECVAKVSLLNFKLHMNCYQLIHCRDDLKKKKLELEVKRLLDDLAILNNDMAEIKMVDTA